jgi:uncharacterized membrane protein
MERDHIDLSPGATAGSDARTMLLVIYGLYFAGFVTGGVTTIVGVVLAYLGRGSAPQWAETHYDFQIRTFWLALVGVAALVAYTVVSAVLVLALIGIPLLLLLGPLGLALAIWYGLRCAVGFNHAVNNRGYPHPATLLI